MREEELVEDLEGAAGVDDGFESSGHLDGCLCVVEMRVEGEMSGGVVGRSFSGGPPVSAYFEMANLARGWRVPRKGLF